jgi:hypothetical protein
MSDAQDRAAREGLSWLTEHFLEEPVAPVEPVVQVPPEPVEEETPEPVEEKPEPEPEPEPPKAPEEKPPVRRAPRKTTPKK